MASRQDKGKGVAEPSQHAKKRGRTTIAIEEPAKDAARLYDPESSSEDPRLKADCKASTSWNPEELPSEQAEEHDSQGPLPASSEMETETGTPSLSAPVLSTRVHSEIIEEDDQTPVGVLVNDNNVAGSILLTAQQSEPTLENTAMKKMHPILALVTASAGIIIGYEMGVIGGVMAMDSFLYTFFRKFLMDEHNTIQTNFCKYQNHVLRFVISSLYFSGTLSCFIAFHLWKIWGSRRNILVAALLCFAGAICMFGSSSRFILICGRVLIGIGVGFIYQAVPQYILETNQSTAEEIQSNNFQLGIASGFFLAYLVNYFAANDHKLNWQFSMAIAFMPCTIFLLCSLVLNETPTRLIKCGKIEQAKKILRIMKESEDIDGELESLLEACQAEQQVENPWKEMSKSGGYPSLIISIMSQIFLQLAGVNFVIFYSPLIFRALDLKKQASLPSVFIGATILLNSAISLLLIRFLGRRIVLLGSCLIMFSVQVTCGIVFYNLKPKDHLDHEEALIITILLTLYVMGFSTSSGPSGWLSVEFPKKTKSLGFIISGCSYMLLTGVMSHISLSMICHMRGYLFIYLGGVIMLMGFFIYSFIPETEGVSENEYVKHVWIRHWLWKRLIYDQNQM